MSGLELGVGFTHLALEGRGRGRGRCIGAVGLGGHPFLLGEVGLVAVV